MWLRYYYDYHQGCESYSNILTETAKTMPVYLESLAEWFQGDKYYTRREKRDSYYLHYTVSGSGIMEYRNKQVTLSEGQLCLIYCMEPQFYATKSGEIWHSIWFHIKGEGAKAYFELINKNGFNVMNLSDRAFVKNKYEELKKNIRRKDAVSASLINCILTELLHNALIESEKELPKNESILPEWMALVHDYIKLKRNQDITILEIAQFVHIPPYELENMFRIYEGKELSQYIREIREDYNKENDANIKCQNPSWVEDAISYIEQNFRSKINFADLAKACHVSQPVFYRNFRRYTCKSPSKCLLQIRLKNAMHAFDTTDDSITNIANNSGFASPSDLSKKFKEWVGMTPKEYRNKKLK